MRFKDIALRTIITPIDKTNTLMTLEQHEKALTPQCSTVHIYHASTKSLETRRRLSNLLVRCGGFVELKHGPRRHVFATFSNKKLAEGAIKVIDGLYFLGACMSAEMAYIDGEKAGTTKLLIIDNIEGAGLLVRLLREKHVFRVREVLSKDILLLDFGSALASKNFYLEARGIIKEARINCRIKPGRGGYNCENSYKIH